MRYFAHRRYIHSPRFPVYKGANRYSAAYVLHAPVAAADVENRATFHYDHAGNHIPVDIDVSHWVYNDNRTFIHAHHGKTLLYKSVTMYLRVGAHQTTPPDPDFVESTFNRAFRFRCVIIRSTEALLADKNTQLPTVEHHTN
jgi:hypothetical protein